MIQLAENCLFCANTSCVLHTAAQVGTIHASTHQAKPDSLQRCYGQSWPRYDTLLFGALVWVARPSSSLAAVTWDVVWNWRRCRVQTAFQCSLIILQLLEGSQISKLDNSARCALTLRIWPRVVRPLKPLGMQPIQVLAPPRPWA